LVVVVVVVVVVVCVVCGVGLAGIRGVFVLCCVANQPIKIKEVNSKQTIFFSLVRCCAKHTWSWPARSLWLLFPSQYHAWLLRGLSHHAVDFVDLLPDFLVNLFL
jgi:hypothetical protein